MSLVPATPDTFPHTWTARTLTAPPMILPARHVMYPQRIPGEDEAMARGALLLEIHPHGAGTLLATCSLGFRHPSLPTGVYACPSEDHLLAVAGGYAYLVDTRTPETCIHLPLKPVAHLMAVAAGVDEPHGLLLLAGFHTLLALDAHGVRWQSARLTWEGLTLSEVRNGVLHGLGWDMHSNRELPFTLDLKTGAHEGGAFPAANTNPDPTASPNP